MAAPRFARRLGWRSLRKVVDPGDLHDRPASFWRGLAVDLAYAMAAYDIWHPIQAAHFISQLAHESAGFRATTEFANGRAYDKSVDPVLARALGNTHDGDGPRFKGRSFVMITGRANYRALPHWDGIDFEKHPEKLAQRKYAALAAAHWWKAHGLNAVADDGSDATVVRVTRIINGGINGLAERRTYFKRAYPIRWYLTPSRRPPT